MCVCCVFKIFGGCLQDFWPFPPERPFPRTASSDGRPLRRTAQNFALFFLSTGNFILSSLLGWFFESRGAHMFTFGLSGCCVEGLHTTTRQFQMRTFERPGASNTTREGRKERILRRGGKKKRNFGPPNTSGPSPLRSPTTQPAHRPTRPPPHQKKLGKCGLAKFGQIWPNSTK